MNSIADTKELIAACKAKGYNPVALSGLAHVLRVCTVAKFKYKNCNMWHYELKYRGFWAYERLEKKKI